MKIKLIVPLLIVTVLGVAVVAQPRTDAQTAGDTSAVGPTPKSYLVTSPVCIQYGGNQSERVYVNADITVG